MHPIRTAVILLLICIGLTTSSQESGSLTVVNFGGSFARACQEGFQQRFEKETGIQIVDEDYNGGLAQMRAQVEANSISWDVVYMEGDDIIVACDEGILDPLEDVEFSPAPDGTPAEADFIANTELACGVPQLFYSTYVAFDPRQFEGQEEPNKIEDFFDLEKFPGRRGVPRKPEVVLEMALMADGVLPRNVYETLSTESGVRKAFEKLDSIKDSIVWWEAGAQPPQMLADGEVSMTIAWNGRIFNAQVVEGQPFKDIWDGQVLDVGFIAVPKDAPNKEAALDFVQHAVSTESLVGVSSRIAYSPSRHSAAKLVDKHVSTGVDMQNYMPNNPDLPGRRLVADLEFWADNAEDLTERLSAWLAN